MIQTFTTFYSTARRIVVITETEVKYPPWPMVNKKTWCIILTLIVYRGGFLHHPKCREKKCPCSDNNRTALVEQAFLFDTALVKTNT